MGIQSILIAYLWKLELLYSSLVSASWRETRHALLVTHDHPDSCQMLANEQQPQQLLIL
jgi:hypothetical protein